jgi:hypothetical protein
MDFSKHAKVILKCLYDRFTISNAKNASLQLCFIETLIERYDIDIQSMNLRYWETDETRQNSVQMFESMKAAQSVRFCVLQSIKQNASLVEFRSMLLCGDNILSMLRVKDMEGRGLLHHAAFMGRIDVLNFLAEDHHMDLKAKDFSCQLAEAAGQTSFALRVRRLLALKLLPDFCIRRWRSHRSLRMIRSTLRKKSIAATLIQSIFRQYRVYKHFGSHLREARGNWMRFKLKWAPGKYFDVW